VAGSSLLALIDDISTILDDVALMSKVAAKKTAGVLGDDLALNAHQVAGVHADRELAVVWAVAKGSLVNKAILVPAALVISAFIPWAVSPLLMLGGAYLCYEGFEKIAHKLMHDPAAAARHAAQLNALADPTVDLIALEKAKIKGAIRTDFILSAEIVVIALGTVANAAFGKRVAVLVAIAVIMTAGVYGFVAAIVKLDDAGLHLSQLSGNNFWSKIQRAIGAMLLKLAPLLMKGLSIVGTIAMFMVGGGILAHGIPGAHDWIDKMAHGVGWIPIVGGILEKALPPLLDVVIGIFTGMLVLAGITVAARIFRLITKRS
jgi:predicted DNA repair protein MutK